MGNAQGTTDKALVENNSSTSFESIEQRRLENTFQVASKGLKTTLSIEDFKGNLFASVPQYGQQLFHKSGKEALTKIDFIEWGKAILGLITLSQQVDFYVNLFSDEKFDKKACEKLLHCCYKTAMCTAGFKTTEISEQHEFIAAMKSMFSSEESLSGEDVARWCSLHCKRLFETLHFYTTAVLRGDTSLSQADTNARSDSKAKLKDTVLNQSLSWLLSCHLPSCYFPSVDTDVTGLAAFSSSLAAVLHPNGWQLLYSSNLHGLGKNRFLHHVINYKAPTVMLISFEDHLYVIAADEEWREETSTWGGENCMLLQAIPAYRQMQAGAKRLWFNLEDRTAPKGLKFGRDGRTTFLEIDADISKVKHYGVDFKLEKLEVWGCGGTDALDAQSEQKDWEKKQAEKAKMRKLKLEDWKDNPDKQLLNMGGVTTEHAQR